MMRFQLDTENSGNDEVLIGDSIEEVTQDVLNRYECDALPEGWSITPIGVGVELAVKDEHGAWELLGDFATVEAAKNAAKEYAAQGQYHIDDHGVMVFGISEDPASGQYEIAHNVDTRTLEEWAN